MGLPIPNGAVRFENVTIVTDWGCVTPDSVFLVVSVDDENYTRYGYVLEFTP